MDVGSAACAAGAAAAGHRSPAGSPANRLVSQARRGEHGQQAPRPDVAVGARRNGVGVSHAPALVEDGVTGRAAKFVDGHQGPPPAAYVMPPSTMEPAASRNGYGCANA